ncbi:MAG: DUF2007 domain-containing protein [Paludibacter sp.]
MSIIRLVTCNNIVDANFIKNNLENEEIECFLTNEISSTLIPAYNGMLGAGIQIMIDEKDLEKAIQLIPQPETEKAIQCPNCDSTNITYGMGRSKLKKYLLIALSLLNNIPLGNLKGNYQCKDCEHNF